MITIDGSAGEGGGQVLRTALALSLVTGTPFRIVNVRARRQKPGLLRQHLAAVRAAATIGRADVEGDALGSSEVVFRPRGIEHGSFELSIGSAGSTTLVLQTVLPALLRAAGPTTIAIEGGTHNPLAPPFEFVADAFAPVLARMGAKLSLSLVRHGFAPAGGGRIEATIEPSSLAPVAILERGPLVARRARAIVASVPFSVAKRELAVVERELGIGGADARAETVDAGGPGNAVLITIAHRDVTEVIASYGARGVPAERVAADACREAARYLATETPVGVHLADQLILPMALAGGGTIRTTEPSQHTRTQLDLVPRFVGASFRSAQEEGGAWRIDCTRA